MIASALLVACTSGTDSVDGSGTDTEPTTTVPTSLTLEEWIARSEGAWAGTADPSPVGSIPFALTFVREGNGDLSASSSNSGFEFDCTTETVRAGG